MPSPEDENALLIAAAQGGDQDAFARLVAPHRRELLAHGYRMSGSVHDAEDTLQETLLAAWRGLHTFAGRSSLRTWLYQIATHACLRLIERRPTRLLSPDHGPAREDTAELGAPVPGPVWVEPLADAPGADARHERRENVELAFVAALQHLPGNQRAVLLLCEVLDFSAAETAQMLELSVAAVNSALARARQTLAQRRPAATQSAELDVLGEDGVRELCARFVAAWERSDMGALLSLLTEDVRFTMPPLPAWFDGREAVARFFRERVFATPWRLLPIRANGQVGFACYLEQEGRFGLGAVNLLTLRGGRIARIDAFLDPATHQQFGLPATPA